jgi:hypothetical protein
MSALARAIATTWHRNLIVLVVVLLCATGAGTGAAEAQVIEPDDLVPAPAGTNLAIGYYVYGHNPEFNIAGGPTVKNSGLEVNLGVARYVHYTSLFGHAAGYQINEAFGSESGGHIGSERLGSAFGASNPELSAFFWPYADTVKKQYLVVVGFIYPPIGTYDKGSPLNLASAFSNWVGWAGAAQVGWNQGIGDHFSYDLAADMTAYGATTGPYGLRNNKAVAYRLQGWANWRWSPVYETSVGWESQLGGSVYTDDIATGSKSEFGRLRAVASAFVAPNAQVLLELSHDVYAVGGFRQIIGATARFVFIF